MPKGFDVFLSYNRGERLAVLILAEALRELGLGVWLDEWVLPPGEPWQKALEDAIETIPAAAVLVGEHGRGPWQELEMRGFLSEFVRRKARIIPVLLPGAPESVSLPPFLNQFNWLDLRAGLTTEGLDRLTWGIRGKKPRKRRAKAISAQTAAPEPSYLDEMTRTLSENLSDAYQRKEDMAVKGCDTRKVDQEILELRRCLREGGRLRAGDFLAEGRLRLIEPLGHGGFSTVWKAFDRKEQGLVAVKVLHGQFAEDRTRLDRFFRGARKMGELHHPNIVRVLDRRVEDAGYHFFVMEYVPGGDLRKAVLDMRLGPETALPLLGKVAWALQFAHDNGVIHRDVKPANILLDKKGQPKLTDFDLVRAFDTTGGTMLGGGMMGTFLYTAPEVMEEPGEACPAADVYSLAMTVAFCLFRAELPREILRDQHSFLRKLPCSPEFRALLGKAMEDDPERRFRSVEEFARELEALDWTLSAGATHREAGLAKENAPAVTSEVKSLVGEPGSFQEVRATRPHGYRKGIRYEDFYIRIEALPERGSVVKVMSPVGHATSYLELPFRPEEFWGLHNADLFSQGVSAEEIGKVLFRALFSGEIGTLFQSSLASVRYHGNKGFRIRLDFDLTDPRLLPVASLPWELLWESERKDFLSRIRQTPIVRFLRVARPPLSRLKEPLRVLVVQSAPVNLPVLNLQAEWGEIWRELKTDSKIQVASILHPSLAELRRRLLENPCHVLHFMGHGGFGEETGEGYLYLEDSGGNAERITGLLLGEHLKSLPDLRLVVLNFCGGGSVPRRHGQDPFTGTANALILAGIPAVVAMQSPISDAAAIAFSSNFYARIAAGDPVDAAAVEGRLAMLRDAHDQPGAWASLIVFTRVPDGDILGRTRADRYRTGEKCPRNGIYVFDGYLGGSWSPAPTEYEERISINVGEAFPPMRSQHKACWWKLSLVENL
jgi:protein kinase-like protein/CHAT domain-containing protein/TIR domain-containing protein/YjzC-like protein